MTALNVTTPDGATHSVSVDDSFFTSAPDVQEKTVNEIAASLGGPAPDTSFASAPQHSLATAEGQGRSLARVVGGQLPDGTPGKDAITGWGNSPQFFTDPKGYVPANPMAAVHTGQYGKAALELGRAAVEGAAPMGLDLAAGAAGGPWAMSAMAGAQSLGPNAEARAAANNEPLDATGHQTVSGQSLLTSLPATVVDAAAARYGMSPGTIPGVVGRAITRANPLVRGAAEVAGTGLVGGAQSLANQVGTTLGTTKGLTVDPDQVANAAAAGAVTRAGFEGAGAVGSGVRAGVEKTAGLAYDDPSAPMADAMSRTDAAILKEQQDSPRKLSYEEAANNLRSRLTGNIVATGQILRSSGAVDSPTYNSVILPLIGNAVRHNQELPTAPVDEAGAQKAFAALQDISIPEADKRQFTADLQSVSLLSQAARKNRSVGPFEAIVGAAGKVAGVPAGFMLGGPMGGLAALAGQSAIGTVSGRAGRLIDTALGTRAPELSIRADAANKVLSDAGLTPSDNPMTTSAALLARLQDPQGTMLQSLGINRDSVMKLPSQFADMSAADANALPDPMKTALAAQIGLPKDILQQHLAAGVSPQEVANFVAQTKNGLGPAGYRALMRTHVQSALDEANRQTQALQDTEAANAATNKLRAQQTATAEAQRVAQNRQSAPLDQADVAAAAQKAKDGATAAAVLRSQQQRAQATTDAAQAAAAQSDGLGPAIEANTTAGERFFDREGLRRKVAGEWPPQGSEAAFESSDGAAGSPAGHTDPLIVRGQGAPAPAAPTATGFVPDTASDVRVATAPDGPAVPPLAPQAVAAVKAAQLKAALDATVQHVAPDQAEAVQAPPKPLGPLPTGWVSYGQRGVQMATGKTVDPNHIVGAVRDLVRSGQLDPLVGEQMLSHGGNVPGEMLTPVIVQAMRRAGLGHMVIGGGDGAPMAPSGQPDGPGGQTGVTPSGRGPIQDLTRWYAARDDVKAYVAAAANKAEQGASGIAGDPQLAQAVRRIGAAKSADDKAAIKAKFLATLPRGRGAQLLRHVNAVNTLDDPTLMRGV